MKKTDFAAGENEWQVQEAKGRLSELIAKAHRAGPQTITRHGQRVAVVVDAEEFDRLTAVPKSSLLEFFRSAPIGELTIPARDSSDVGREIDL